MFSLLYSQPSPVLHNSDNEDSIFLPGFLKEEKTIKLNSSSCYCELFERQQFVFFFTSQALKKPWVGKCLSGREYGPLQPVAAEVSGQSGELLLPAPWPSPLFWVSLCRPSGPEATWVLFKAPACPARMLPPLPGHSSLLRAPKARYRGGMRLPQEINHNCYRNWLQDSTKHRVSTCKENLAVSDFIFHWNPPLAFSNTGHTKQIDF